MKRYHSVSPTFRGKLDNESVRPNRVEKNKQTIKQEKWVQCTLSPVILCPINQSH